jgi:hypothetical protein
MLHTNKLLDAAEGQFHKVLRDLPEGEAVPDFNKTDPTYSRFVARDNLKLKLASTARTIARRQPNSPERQIPELPQRGSFKRVDVKFTQLVHPFPGSLKGLRDGRVKLPNRNSCPDAVQLRVSHNGLRYFRSKASMAFFLRDEFLTLLKRPANNVRDELLYIRFLYKSLIGLVDCPPVVSRLRGFYWRCKRHLVRTSSKQDGVETTPSLKQGIPV